MKRTLFSLMSMLLIVSCSGLVEQEDPADGFVGTYTYSSVEYVTWGAASGTVPWNGTFRVTKTGSNTISLSGSFNTTGTVSGTTMILSPHKVSDGAGYIYYGYTNGFLSGDVLSFTVTSQGELADNGRLYPYNGRMTVQGIRTSK